MSENGNGHRANGNEHAAQGNDYKVPAPLTWFEMPELPFRGHALAKDSEAAEWPAHPIDQSLTVAHGISILDWDGDGRDEILTASFEGVHLFHSAGRGAEMTWTRTQLAAGDRRSTPKRGASEIGVGKVGGKRFLATIEPWHGNQVVVYLPQGQQWKRVVLEDRMDNGHALAVGDLDGDGRDEIVCGFRGKGHELSIYQAADDKGEHWRKTVLDDGIAAADCVIEDFTGDGKPDIACIGASTGNLKLYINLGK